MDGVCEMASVCLVGLDVDLLASVTLVVSSPQAARRVESRCRMGFIARLVAHLPFGVLDPFGKQGGVAFAVGTSVSSPPRSMGLAGIRNIGESSCKFPGLILVKT